MKAITRVITFFRIHINVDHRDRVPETSIPPSKLEYEHLGNSGTTHIVGAGLRQCTTASVAVTDTSMPNQFLGATSPNAHARERKSKAHLVRTRFMWTTWYKYIC